MVYLYTSLATDVCCGLASCDVLPQRKMTPAGEAEKEQAGEEGEGGG